ncbi:phage tail assembly protein [Kitasatospora sp. NPDC048540]|uniref:phage tail assembly protein n=1 Tax=Kitasatospora sp. NPDC048540 TaxID=3155634 RepID=UPI0033C9F550
MASYTLDNIRAAAEAKYGSTDIELSAGSVVRLLNPLRLPKATREELQGLQDQMEADGADQEALMEGVIRLVADNPKKGDALIAAIGGDLAVLAEIVETYSKSTQVGEASASAA